MYIIQNYIHDFTWQNDEEWVWTCIHQFFQSSLQNFEISKSLGGDPDYQNAKQIFNAMILQHKTQNKNMIRYLNKQNFCVSYMDVEIQRKKSENDVLMERVVQVLYWIVSTHSNIDNVDE